MDTRPLWSVRFVMRRHGRWRVRTSNPMPLDAARELCADLRRLAARECRPGASDGTLALVSLVAPSRRAVALSRDLAYAAGGAL